MTIFDKYIPTYMIKLDTLNFDMSFLKRESSRGVQKQWKIGICRKFVKNSADFSAAFSTDFSEDIATKIEWKDERDLGIYNRYVMSTFI